MRCVCACFQNEVGVIPKLSDTIDSLSVFFQELLKSFFYIHFFSHKTKYSNLIFKIVSTTKKYLFQTIVIRLIWLIYHNLISFPISNPFIFLLFIKRSEARLLKINKISNVVCIKFNNPHSPSFGPDHLHLQEWWTLSDLRYADH